MAGVTQLSGEDARNNDRLECDLTDSVTDVVIAIQVNNSIAERLADWRGIVNQKKIWARHQEMYPWLGSDKEAAVDMPFAQRFHDMQYDLGDQTKTTHRARLGNHRIVTGRVRGGQAIRAMNSSQAHWIWCGWRQSCASV